MTVESRPSPRPANARPQPPARTAPFRREGPAKLAGTARYTDDLVFAGAWYGLTIRSPEPRATFLGVDLESSFDWSRVIVLTADDIPGENVLPSMANDQPILVPLGGEIRFRSEAVALLAAADRETLRAARDRVRVRSTPLPPVFDPLLSDQAFARYELARGEMDAALRQADLVVEGTYRVGHAEQLYIENNAAIALPRDDGGVTVHGSMQCPYFVHEALKRGMGFSDVQAHVIQAETGGGFGGKEDYPELISLHAALLARKLGKPVRMIYDRHEDIMVTGKRHPATIHHRTAVLRDGTILGQDIEIVMDGGAYATLSGPALLRCTMHAGGPYNVPNVRIRSRVMATNTPPNGAFRGFGVPQSMFAGEIQLNRVAEAIGRSAIEIRRQMAYRPGDQIPIGQTLKTASGVQVLERALDLSDFEARRRATARERASRTERDRVAHGIGLALGWHGAGFTGSHEVRMGASVTVELTAEGRIRVLSGSTEMGQGARTVLPSLAAAELGLAVDEVEIAPVDTAIVPDSGPTVASRTTMTVGRMTIGAARALRAEVEARTGRPFAESYRHDAATHGPTRANQGFVPYSESLFDNKTLRGDAYPTYGWAAAVAEVEVDLDTAGVRVVSMVAVDDAGRIINPTLAAGQVEGATVQAVGYATLEEIKLVDGRYLNDRLQTYLIPTALDAPRIATHFVETPFEGAPHGAKSIGEMPIDVGAPAVVDAIHDAIGAWIQDLPASPERIMAALAGIEGPPPPGVSLSGGTS